MSFSLYRATHQTHHAHLTTERDEEFWPFVKPHSPRWSGSRGVLELTAVSFHAVLVSPHVSPQDSPIRSRKCASASGRNCADAVVWTRSFRRSSYFGVWRYFLWMYVVPAFIAGNLQSWRKYIEHVGLTGDTVNSSTRSIVAEGRLGHRSR